ncbi:nicotinamidase-like [Hylaeus volcanicus]|uniref:nicotinamidase-like n=1 Tax=Hylaeus volcanicus TaxID=313075 RepID=UPI0023B7ECAA|nr:nicotinamidase-like [Hylaeus volcanicus]
METRSAESMIESFGGKKWTSIEKFLANFDLPIEESTLNYESFRVICAALFPPDEIQQNDWMIQNIFRLFDCDRDGILKGQEWKTFCDWLRVMFEPVIALLIVDVQNDFIDGSLALRDCGCNQDGVDVVEPINYLIKEGQFDKIIYSRDWHPENHISFYENLHLRELHPDSKITKENAKPFDTVMFADPHLEQKLWPKHCVMNTKGSDFHKALVIAPGAEQVRKGQDPEVDSYSVFFDNNSKNTTQLLPLLKEARVTHVFICGLAYDVCVKSTALDGLRLGYPVAVINDCCRGVDTDDIEDTKKLISENGGLIVNSEDVLSLVNEKKRSVIMSHQSAKMMTSISFSERSVNTSAE